MAALCDAVLEDGEACKLEMESLEREMKALSEWGEKLNKSEATVKDCSSQLDRSMAYDSSLTAARINCDVGEISTQMKALLKKGEGYEETRLTLRTCRGEKEEAWKNEVTAEVEAAKEAFEADNINARRSVLVKEDSEADMILSGLSSDAFGKASRTL